VKGVGVKNFAQIFVGKQFSEMPILYCTLLYLLPHSERFYYVRGVNVAYLLDRDYVVLSRCAPHQLVFNLRRFSRIGRFVSEIYLLMHPVDNFTLPLTRGVQISEWKKPS